MTPLRRALLVALALAAIVVAGTALRLLPLSADPAGTFVSDAAFHYRMVRTLETAGRLPAVDSLATAPEGRTLDRLLPLGFYRAFAAGDRLLGLFGRHDPRANALLLLALAGALIALPAFGAAWALTRSPWAGLTAALLATAMPAHVHRTFCFWFRYESPGTLLITTHLALGLAALAARGRRAGITLAALSGLALILALDTWRVAFMLPVIETGFVLGWALLRPPGAAVRTWFTGLVAGGTVACLAIGYLRAQAFGLSPAWWLAMVLALALWAPALRRDDSRWRTRAVLLAAVVVAAAILGALTSQPRQYGTVLHAALARVAAALGRGHAPYEPMTSLALSVDELAAGSGAELLGPGGLGWLGLVFVAGPLLAWWLAGRPGPARLTRVGAAPALLAWLAASLTVATLLFTRGKVLLGPIAAVVISWLVAAFAAMVGPRAARGRAWVARVALALIALASVATAIDAVRLAATRTATIEPDLAAALEYIRHDTPRDAVVLSTWERGYEVQTWAERRTLVDGLLEDPRVRERLPEIAEALLRPTPDSLLALCRRHGASVLLVPPSNWLLAVLRSAPEAMRPELAPVETALEQSRPLDASDADRVLIHMMVLGETPAGFAKHFERGGWRVYQLLPTP